jgi:hypothetical protein
VDLCTLFEVVGHEVPGVGNSPAALLARLHQLTSHLEETPAHTE